MKKLLLILLCLPFIGFGQTTWTPCDSSFSININSQNSIEVVYSVSGPNLNMNSNLSWVYFNMLGSCIGGSSYNSQTDTVNINNNLPDSTAIMCLITDSLSSCIVIDTLVYDSLTGWSMTSNQFLALQTYVPDDNFEQALINLGYDNLLDDYIMTANIDTITYLDVSFENISDLTGIEAFVNLTELLASDNQLINLDISNNTALIDLQCGTNQLVSLDVSNNPNLLWIRCYENQLTSLDLSNNTSLKSLECRSNQLTTLDVNGATSLTDLICYSNSLTTLDLSSNIELISLDFAYNQISSINVSNNEDLITLGAENNLLNSIDVSNNTKLENLICYSNQLLSADVRNGNNQNAEWYMFSDNPNLECISVDNPTYSTNNWLVSFGMIDSTMYFSSNCSLPALIIEANTTNKELLKVTDLLGRETKQTNQPLFYIYDNGTVEKRIVIE